MVSVVQYFPVSFIVLVLSFAMNSYAANPSLSQEISAKADREFRHLLECQELLNRLPKDVRSEKALAPEQIKYKLEPNANSPKLLLLLHDIGSDLRSFDSVSPILAQNYNILRVSLRGHGGTESPGYNFSSQLMADDVKCLIDDLGVGRITLVGHGMGAKVAVRFAALYPSRVDALVLEDPNFATRPMMGGSSLRRLVNEQKRNRDVPREWDSVKDLTQWLGRLSESAKYSSLRFVRFNKENGTAHLMGWPYVLPLAESQVEREEYGMALTMLRDLKKPILVVQTAMPSVLGADSNVVPLDVNCVKGDVVKASGCSVRNQSDAKIIMANAPSATVVGIEVKGPSVHRAAPEKFAEMVKDFLDFYSPNSGF